MKTNLETLFDSYKAAKLIHAKPHTKRKYGYAIRHFDRFCGRQSTTDDFSDETLSAFLGYICDLDCSNATANSYLAHLVALWNFAWRRGIVSTGPTVRPIRECTREPVAFTNEEIAKLLSAADRVQYSICGISGSQWWRSLILCLYDTGLRVSACRTLRFADVRLRDGSILIRGEYQKSGKDARKVIHQETFEAIESIRQPIRQLVWPWQWTDGYFWHRSSQLFADAGLPNDRRYKFHAIRRTHGTMVAKTMGDFAAAESLQHSNVNTFRTHYLDRSQLDAANVIDALPRPVNK